MPPDLSKEYRRAIAGRVFDPRIDRNLRLGKAPALKKRDNKKSYDFHRCGWLENAAGYGWPLLAG
jgi:hypothetical protein